MKPENQEQRKQGMFVFPGALDSEVMPGEVRHEAEPAEVRGPPKAEREADTSEEPGCLDPARQVTATAEELAAWKKHAEEMLSTFKREQAHLTRASEQYQAGGWNAVTCLNDEEKHELKEQVGRDLAAGQLPIPRFVPSYLTSSIKRLEERVAELETLRPADAPGDEAQAQSEQQPEAAEKEAPNAYEQRLAERKERLQDAAEKARERSGQQYQRAHELTDHIPLGQPILRGHHSEKRHRAEIRRSHKAMDRFVEESKKAEELERRAKKVGTGGVSADDPTAVGKLQAKLEKMEARRDTMKRINKEFRKGGWDAVTGLSDEVREKLHAQMVAQPWKGGKPFETYELTNLGANIRRVKARIEALSEAQERETSEAIEESGYRFEEDKSTNRMRFFFDSKPSEDVRGVLKANGFKWAPSVKAWQRQASANGRAAATRVRKQLEQLRG